MHRLPGGHARSPGDRPGAGSPSTAARLPGRPDRLLSPPTVGPSDQHVSQADAGGAGSSLPKQLLVLAGTTLLERSVAAFDAAPGVDEVLVVMAAGFTELATQVLGAIGYRKLTGVIEGGAARADSTRRAITALSGAAGGDRNVLFHDAARPLVDQRIIADCVT